MQYLTFSVTVVQEVPNRIFAIRCEQNERFVSAPWDAQAVYKFTQEHDALNYVEEIMRKQDKNILHIESLFVSKVEKIMISDDEIKKIVSGSINDLLEYVLFLNNWEDSELEESKFSTDDFSEKTVEGMKNVLANFTKLACEKRPDLMIKIDQLERAYGGNVYASMTGHGIGFFDDSSELSELMVIVDDSPEFKYKFEDCSLVENSDGLLEIESY